ncbi:MAG: hypothetical protein ACOYKE_13790 [Ferruginibacter sp.]
MKYTFLFLIVIALSCCNTKGKTPIENPSTLKSSTTGLQLDSMLLSMDSIVLVHFTDPYGPDSLRYTRFYTQVSIVDSFTIRLLQQSLNTAYTREDQKRNCRIEGKIWCFSKGKIFQTIYFSSGKESQCRFMYWIKDGSFYFFPYAQSLELLLNQWRMKEIMP